MEILTDLQKRILNLFTGLPDRDAFYLTGGTALSAFYLKHRKSHDLDFFTAVEDIIPPFSRTLELSLKKASLGVERLRGFHSFVELAVHSSEEQTIIHLAADSPFRFERPVAVPEFPGLQVDSLIDIASNKLLALFGRATLRDFIDVYFLAQEYFDKKVLIEKAGQKDPGFDLYWLGVAFERINDFSDGSPDMHLLGRPCTMKDLKDFFNGWRKKIAQRLTEGTK